MALPQTRAIGPPFRRRLFGIDRSEVWTGATAAGAAAFGASVAVTLGPMLPVAAVVLAVGLVCGIASWRRSITWMLYYLPFSGLLPLILYPNTGPGTLLKDFVFVGPAYV